MRQRALAGLLAGASVALAVLPASAAEPPSTRPNVIYIMADDLGYGDLGCYGQTKIKTPRLDQMAHEGMRFTQHYSASTVCAPTRCCLMTGFHTGHAYIRGNADKPLRPDDVTIAEVLKRAGYTTAVIGKWGLGEAGSTGVPTRQGFDYFFGYLNQRRAHFYYPEYLWRNEEKVHYPDNDPDALTGQYSHDLIIDEALAFIERSADGPFFLYLPLTIPHAQPVVPEDSVEPYRGVFPETPFHSKFYRIEQPTPRAVYAGMISRMDRDIGRLLDLLRDLDLDERTLVVFASDNGPSDENGPTVEFFDTNGPFRGIKRDLYEGGLRVPQLAWWPGTIEPNSVSLLLTSQFDILPTAAELAGVPAPEGIDGHSIVPTLRGRPAAQSKHDYLYWEFYEYGGKQAVRDGPWKGVRLDVRDDRDAPLEVYHLLADPGEQHNLAAVFPEKAKELAERMQAAHQPSELFRFEKR